MVVFLVTFLIGLYSLLVQTFSVKNSILATLIGGVLSMLGGAMGAFGAYLVARYQLNTEKKEFEEREIQNNRSFIVINDFQGPIGLKNVKTHENSRLIRTEGYEELKKSVSKDDYDYTSTSYIKISHYGNSDVIMDCNICISSENEQGSQLPDILVNTGVLEKHIELFIPIAQPLNGVGNTINLSKIVVEYSTLMNERLKCIMDFSDLKERHCAINKRNEEDILFEFDVIGSKWTYPNKRKD